MPPPVFSGSCASDVGPAKCVSRQATASESALSLLDFQPISVSPFLSQLIASNPLHPLLLRQLLNHQLLLNSCVAHWHNRAILVSGALIAPETRSAADGVVPV